MFKMNSKILIWLALLMGSNIGGLQMAGATSSPLTDYAWQDRLLVMVTEPDQSALREAVNIHFTTHACAHKERNLRLLSFMTTDAMRASLPDVMRSKTGLWLIGYDSGIKAYSADASLLTRLHDIIDDMPIRRREKEQQTTNCPDL